MFSICSLRHSWCSKTSSSVILKTPFWSAFGKNAEANKTKKAQSQTNRPRQPAGPGSRHALNGKQLRGCSCWGDGAVPLTPQPGGPARPNGRARDEKARGGRVISDAAFRHWLGGDWAVVGAVFKRRSRTLRWLWGGVCLGTARAPGTAGREQPPGPKVSASATLWTLGGQKTLPNWEMRYGAFFSLPGGEGGKKSPA